MKRERTVSAVSMIRALASLVMLVLMMLAGATLRATEAAVKEKYEEKFQKTESLAPDGKVYLGNVSGNVRIIVWNNNEVKIDAVKISKAGSFEKAKENAASVNIEIKRTDNQLDIQTEYPELQRKKSTLDVSVDYVLTVPARAGLTVNNVSGDIDAENAGGLIKLQAVSGNITVANCANGVLNAVSGNITLRGVAGDFKARTVSGSISIEKASGSLSAETVSGKVLAKDLSNAGSVDVNCASGNVFLEGGLNPKGRYSLETHSGDITVSVPESAAFDFTYWAFSGEYHSDFKIIMGSADKEKGSQREIRGQVNGGGADLTIKTFSGDINLKKQGK